MDALLDKIKATRTVAEATALLKDELPTLSTRTEEALRFAETAHQGQFRKSGEPYIVHPILVAAITAAVSGDETMVQAALLHDVVEDTPHTLEEIRERFGDDVAHIVEGLTKIVTIRDEKLIPSGSDEKLVSSALSFRKMLIASIKDIRVLVIKLCDRLHNMLTLDALPPHKQKRIAEETLVVYAPIAHRLGIARLKNYLEDLSFYYIYPEDYAKIDAYMRTNAQNLQFKLNAFIQKVRRLMEENGFSPEKFDIFGRVKHYYSIYLKMHRKGVSIDEVLDLLAIRVIVNEPLECYKVLGLMHLHFTPLISRFKDYIAVPKENGYKTIHTTLFNQEGIVEAQIRTQQMHRLAEYGVAAHWKYKEAGNSVNLQWLESLSFQNESVEEFYELAKSDLFSEDITVFSPKGDYFTLPKGSVALDFAYLIHSEVGANATGALINKHPASLLSVLKNGDVVKILKDDTPHLHCSWIDAVKTSRAKEGIRSLCRAREREVDTLSAYNILATMFDLSVSEIQTAVSAQGMQESIDRLPNGLDYFKEAIRKTADYIGAREVRFWELLKKGYKKPQVKEIDYFRFYTNKPLEGVEFDYCCHPKSGDKIVAFYKDTKAIIHHKLCKKAYEKIKAQEPMLFVEWKQVKLARYRLIVALQNKKGALADLLVKLSKLDLNVISIELGIRSSESADYCRIEVESDETNKKALEEKLAQRFRLVEMISLDDAYNK